MDALVSAVYEQVSQRLAEAGDGSMAFPFKVGEKASIAYLPPKAGLEEAKACIVKEWLAMHREPYPCVVDPKEVKVIMLASAHTLTERDQLEIVLSKVDPYLREHYALVQFEQRRLKLFGLDDGEVLLDDSSAIEKAKANSKSVEITVMVNTAVGELNDLKLFNRNDGRLFRHDPEYEYEITGILVIGEDRIANLDLGVCSPLLYALANSNNRLYPLFRRTKRPLWKEFFEFHQELEQTDHGPQLVNYVEIINNPLLDWLKAKLAMQALYTSEQPKLRCNLLIRQVANMRMYGGKTIAVEQLIEWLEAQYKELLAPIKAMIAEGNITFDALWYLFPNGSTVAVPCQDSFMVVESQSANYVESLDCEKYAFRASVLRCNGKFYYKTDRDFSIPGFEGVVPIDSLPVRLASSVKDVDRLCLEQFDQFDRFARGPVQAKFEGLANKLDPNSKTAEGSFFHNGRVMVDADLYAMNGKQPVWYQVALNAEPVKALTDKDKKTVWPLLPVFSHATKAWILAHCNKLSPVVFQNDAFDKVVMPPTRKKLVESVIRRYSDRNANDIVAGKNLGCCLMLYGPPGTGKTLTCEAAAEMLQQPLYSVSVGELGTQPTTVETNLREIFRVASRWKALLLIDEADVFMEKRTHKEIKRNSLVAIFLKMLEYYDGILFLTTNRVGHFDEAILSRMMLTLEYAPLNDQERKQVWINQLKAYATDPAQFEPRLSEIAKLELNGRDINRLLGLANILAAESEQPLCLEHLNQAIEATHRSDMYKLVHHLDSGEQQQSRRAKHEK